MSSPEERLGLSYKVMRTPQVRGRIAEQRMAKDRGARLHPNSGAGKIKDDASSDDVIYEFKNVARTHQLRGKDLLAIFFRAVRQQKEALYVIHFEDSNVTAEVRIRRGR